MVKKNSCRKEEKLHDHAFNIKEKYLVVNDQYRNFKPLINFSPYETHPGITALYEHFFNYLRSKLSIV